MDGQTPNASDDARWVRAPRIIPTMPIAGVVNLFKPTHISSARYVYRLRGLLGERRVGHAGTLDPFADGVLLGCVGAATKLVERLMELPKVYEVGLRLGVTNACFDPELPFDPVPDAVPPTAAGIDAALRQFTGMIEQSPPTYSAIKVAGRAAHLRVRDGETLTLPPRPVRIDGIEVLAYAWPALRLRVACGRGMYVRALARDLGSLWGCGAVCESLRRTAVGPFTSDKALLLRQVDPATVRSALVDVAAIEKLVG